MIPFDQGVSITDLSALTGISRADLPDILTAAGAPLAGNGKGNPLYQLAPAVRAIVASQRAIVGGDQIDPDKLSPRARNDWFASEAKRFRLQVDRGLYVPREAVRLTSAKVIAAFVQTCRGLRDTLERKHGVAPHLAEIVDAALDDALDVLGQGFAKVYEHASTPGNETAADELAAMSATQQADDISDLI
jgi:hypothetical protein